MLMVDVKPSIPRYIQLLILELALTIHSQNPFFVCAVHSFYEFFIRFEIVFWENFQRFTL